jgi:hypothetical protein
MITDANPMLAKSASHSGGVVAAVALAFLALHHPYHLDGP